MDHGSGGDRSSHGKNTGTKNETFQVGSCSCERTLLVERPNIGVLEDSTCGRDSYIRGPGQKVIGFSFYSNPNNTGLAKVRKYFQGIRENLELIPRHYPGWTLRLYHDLQPGEKQHEELCQLACSHNDIDLCYCLLYTSDAADE